MKKKNKKLFIDQRAKKMIDEVDIYQQRYVAHQQKKKEQIMELLDSRSSQRVFNHEPISFEEMRQIEEYMAKAPNSCNRQAVIAMVITERNHKELLSGLLVGGVGWAHRADKIMLLFADQQAYKADGELAYMPYLDAGAVTMAAYMICEVMEIGCCFVNPNVRKENQDIFDQRFNQHNWVFCGALAMGKYDKKAPVSPKKKSITIK